MKSLGFSRRFEHGAGGDEAHPARSIRARSSLPMSAACVVANGVRETLSALLGRGR